MHSATAPPPQYRTPLPHLPPLSMQSTEGFCQTHSSAPSISPRKLCLLPLGPDCRIVKMDDRSTPPPPLIVPQRRHDAADGTAGDVRAPGSPDRCPETDGAAGRHGARRRPVRLQGVRKPRAPRGLSITTRWPIVVFGWKYQCPGVEVGSRAHFTQTRTHARNVAGGPWQFCFL